MASAGDEAAISETAIALARSQLAALQSSIEQIELVAVGMLGFKGALAAAVIAAGNGDLGSRWWAPLPGLGVSMFCDLLTIFAGHEMNWGFSPVDFYKFFGGATAAQANAALLADLETARIAAASETANKRFSSTLALGFLIVTAIYSLGLLIHF
jgi:hypothetical protein